ncbi:carbohydrate ABC transporter permease [Paenibacillus sp. GCM10023248]|uniref:carbohydrate ABC transporter permease n=1 Tax=unclassified Paenibacillus TaxID=185978 RepID=UPI0023786DE9|nr:carbohydrate ABC transporter permease [Paenibacillus sp. MAHUQ-63]MDD9267191.1 carbohydrate ABC transporter permease [Paenibacillus sp. MAHUQ-63]
MNSKPMNIRSVHQVSPGVNILLHVLAAIVAIACVFPFLFVIILSFSDELTLARDGYRIWPDKWSLEAYRYIIQTGEALLRSYGVTIFVTVTGTLIGVAMTTLYAYAISRSNFAYRRFFSFFAVFTLLFNGGMVPTFIVVTQLLHLQNTVWALIWPMAVNAFNILIMRTYFSTMVPGAIIESGKIDGAGEFQMLSRLVLPLSMPGLATIALFTTLAYWNDWFHALLYIEDPELVPLQSMLMRIETSMQFIVQNASNSSISTTILQNMPQETSRMALVVLATGPIVVAYPFFQRYIVQGLTIGAVKE